MKITRLVKQQKNINSYDLEIEGYLYCGLDEALITELNIYLNKAITAQDLNKIIEADSYQKCLNKAFSLLSIRLNSEYELKKKLTRKFGGKTIDKVIYRLKELNYINDEIFARSWIEERADNRGSSLLKKELFKKGLDKSLIGNCFEQIDSEAEYLHAKALVAKKNWTALTKKEKYQKIGGFLMRKGFNYETIKRVLSDS